MTTYHNCNGCVLEECMDKIEKELQLAFTQNKGFGGEARFDWTSKTLFSTDASIYQMNPLGVVFPREQDDLIIAMEIAANIGIPVLPRGSGSSLAGQSIGPALILDCSKYLTSLIDLNIDERTALVEPGLILNELNRRAGKYHLQFGPDPASAERASLGGSVANNAAGAHSIVYGMSADHVLAAEVVLADGSVANLESIDLEYAQRIYANDESVLGKFYQAAFAIRKNNAEEIRLHWPAVWRRSSGYNLNYLLPWSSSQPPLWLESSSSWTPGRHTPLPYPPIEPNCLNLAPLIAGSEGTLAIIRKLKLRLVPLPKHTVLGVLAFDDIATACDAVPRLLSFQPSAIELIPDSLIKLARSVPAYARMTKFIDQISNNQMIPAALLVVEFSGDEEFEIEEKVKCLGNDAWIAHTLEEQKYVWSVRKVGLGILMSKPGSLKPVAFIEDLAVPVEKLGDFVREIDRILQDHHTSANFYAHVSAGCLHIRPLIDLQTGPGVASLRSIAEQAVQLTLGLGGSVSAEHGDGLARSEWLARAYPPSIIRAFKQLKQAVDPLGLLNPGKIVDPEPMDRNLRYGADYRSVGWKSELNFTNSIDLFHPQGVKDAIEHCNGAGVCRKSDGVMCPSFQASHEEMHSTRGRANLLRALISGRFPAKSVAEKAVREALDLCLACKGCKSECPSGVDMAKLRYEFTYQYYRNGHFRQLRDYLFGYIGFIAPLGQFFAPFTNYLLHNHIFVTIAEKLMGLSSKRPFPRFASQSLQNLWKKSIKRPSSKPIETVLFLSDAFTEYFQPEAGLAALKALDKIGCQAIIVPVLGAGRTLISKGFLPGAKQHAKHLVEEIKRLYPDGRLPVVGIEPSEIYTLRDEYLDLFPNDEYVSDLARRCFSIEEFFVRPDIHGAVRIKSLMDNSHPKKSNILLHGHCYQKAQPPAPDGYPVGVSAIVNMLKTVGHTVQVIESGCCGMAGAFGYEAEHYDFSMKVGELQLFPAIRAKEKSGENWIVAASGVSCQAQIEDGTGAQPLHPIQLI